MIITRRDFLGAASVGAGALLTGCLKRTVTGPTQEEIDNATITAKPGTPTATPVIGYSALGLGGARDGFMYVPTSYNPAVPSSLVMMLHRGQGDSSEWENPDMEAAAEEFATVVVAPDSRGTTWDVRRLEYKDDVAFMNAALAKAFSQVNVNPERVATFGLHDGAAEAIGVGVINAGLFRRIVAFAPTQYYVPFTRGFPPIWISHGTNDEVEAYASSENFWVPRLRELGFTVLFVGHEGGHEVPAGLQRLTFDWIRGTTV